MVELPQSVLRYWETVFDPLKPHKSSGGSRQYSDSDIDTINAIKVLLYDQGFTIKGAANRLKSDGINTDSSFDNNIAENKKHKNELITELKEIIKILES
jgi:DNA-binding transcriptional MerR regulator